MTRDRMIEIWRQEVTRAAGFSSFFARAEPVPPTLAAMVRIAAEVERDVREGFEDSAWGVGDEARERARLHERANERPSIIEQARGAGMVDVHAGDNCGDVRVVAQRAPGGDWFDHRPTFGEIIKALRVGIIPHDAPTPVFAMADAIERGAGQLFGRKP